VPIGVKSDKARYVETGELSENGQFRGSKGPGKTLNVRGVPKKTPPGGSHDYQNKRILITPKPKGEKGSRGNKGHTKSVIWGHAQGSKGIGRFKVPDSRAMPWGPYS